MSSGPPTDGPRDGEVDASPTAATSAREAPAVELVDIDKGFFGVKANDRVSLGLRRGEIHALLGENGAGKSTLCSILAGLYRPDAGELLLDGEPISFRSPRDALDAGIGMVYQHFRLVPNLTVAENLGLGHRDLGFRISRRQLERDAAALADRYGLPVDPAARVWQLSVGEQQRVEILKLLYRDVQVLILDEPTAVLTPQEAERFFATLRLLAEEGRSVVFVTHKLDEVLAVSDRVTVLRDGRNVGSVVTADADARLLARMMIGRDLVLPERQAATAPGPVRLEVEDLRVAGDRGLEAVRGVSLSVRAGEIVGLAGVSGNGQRELAEALAGTRPTTGGSIRLTGRELVGTGARERIDAGLSLVPEDRLGTGLAPGLSLADNLALKSYRRPPLSRGPLLRLGAFQERAADLAERFDVRGVRGQLPVRLLSGGNLQKALIAREVVVAPVVLVAASPTRGLDVGATVTVREHLLAQRREGTAVLVISEDLDELLALADRILVIYEGRIVGEVTAAAADTERLGLLMAGRTEVGEGR